MNNELFFFALLALVAAFFVLAVWLRNLSTRNAELTVLVEMHHKVIKQMAGAQKAMCDNIERLAGVRR